MINPFDFDELIAPVTRNEFFEEYWEKKPLVLNNRNASGFSNLMSLKNFDELLFSHSVASSDIHWVRLVNNKKILNAQEYASSQSGGLLNKHKIIEGYKRGNTVALCGQEERFEPLRKLCQEFESVLGHPSCTEVFLTPPSAQGFSAHFDRFSVFVLQLEGKKRWRIYDQHMPFSIVSDVSPFQEGAIPDPLYEIDLSPGDLLYLPRGYVHEVFTTSEYSLHISLGMEVYTWIDLINEIIKNEPEFRRSLPVRALLAENSEKIDPAFFDSMEEVLKDRSNIELAFRKIQSKFAKVKKRSFETSYTLWNDAPQEITSETVFKKRDGVFCSLIMEEDHAILHFGEEELKGPFFIESTLQYIMNTPRFSIKTMPDLLQESGNTLLVKSLMKSGLLVVEK